ncbi:MAG: bifunctional DNA-formamidopyrimidine glycosylase/DNA-(apurinic or apyrimidinic site) lyase [Kordiimonadaceae bacterium]|nr:bifunctional DNA-formamidopyrimidine glycosylase/DNA-(apurinic or apyrimidinic site) lyase [Kordiimonadaceae bacterium]MBO6568755.1 bifunctional DNA-formamidopyrimidine glycosylase/DNA-(apurinic or apyrimidinic site) lyase [Kordiimonadaceae bacterium]MBO6965269.1 bifunctional DNA-formamidopyrimidine glycosylase/DNA-(apurinic or apyrimidinic site) lyase [Kordiimonadaceae bacterium]
MPELPEVETVMRGLAPVMEGVRLDKVRAFVPKLRVDIPDQFEERFSGNRVTQLRRRSKYILIECEDGLVAILHLGMSGRVSIHANGSEKPPREKHDHITFLTERDDLIVFNDPRRFGLIVFSDTDTIQDHALIKDIGPEPLGNSFDADYLWSRLKTRKSPIKTTLLDQKVVAGLGNIYVCEALWRSGIHPQRRADKVKRHEVEKLLPIIRDVLNDAIAAGGSTLKDYAQVSGELGYFQHNFRAYGREGEACLAQKCSGTIERIVQSNRSTFFCPICQP